VNDKERIAALEKQMETTRGDVKRIWVYVRTQETNRTHQLGNVRVDKRQVAAILISLAFGLLNFIRQWAYRNDVRLPWVSQGNMGEKIMEYIHPDFLFVVPVLLGLGMILKKYTKIDNGLIPTINFVVAALMCAIWGYSMSAFTGGDRVFDALVRSGFAQGFLVSAVATKLYDGAHGAKKAQKNRKITKAKEAVNG